MEPRLDSATIQREDAELSRFVHGLVGRREDERDIVQATWLAAFEGDGSRAWRNPQGWLRVVARRIVQRERKRSRLRADGDRRAARSERPGARQEEGDREAALHALSRLEEPYRTVIRLRFFEERSIREIAGALGRPAGTVRSQIHRGLELIRARMSPRQRLERRWAWLAPASWLPARPGRIARRFGSVAALPSLAVVLAVLLAWAGARWTFDADRADPQGTPASLALAAAPGWSAAPPSMEVEDRAEVRRPVESLAPVPDPTRRSSASESGASILELRVVDPERAPVAGASVWVAGAAGFEQRGTSDSSGRVQLELRSAEAGALGIPATRGRISLRATAEGFAASGTLHVPCEIAGQRKLELALGGAELVLRGRVVDAESRAIPGARIDCGTLDLVQSPPGRAEFLTPTPYLARSLDDGSFEIRGLERETQRIHVSAPGYRQDWVRVAAARQDRTLDCTIVLHCGAALSGTVRRSDGTRVPGARVYTEPLARATEWSIGLAGFDPELCGFAEETTADEQGDYRLEGIEPRVRRLWARCPGEGLIATRLIDLGKEREAAWDPVLKASSGHRLQLVDWRGSPLAGLPVRFTDGSGMDRWLRVVASNAEGRLRVQDCPRGRVALEVLDEGMAAVLARVSGLVPDGSERILSIPARGSDPGLVRGTLLDATGAPFRGAELRRYDPRTNSSALLALDPETGRFEQSFPPGPFLLGCIAGERGFSLGEHDLAAAGVLDLGILRAPPTGALHVEGSIGVDPAAESYVLAVEYTAQGSPIFRELARGPWPPPERLELFPAKHWLQARGEDDRLLCQASAEVVAGGDTWLELAR